MQHFMSVGDQITVIWQETKLVTGYSIFDSNYTPVLHLWKGSAECIADFVEYIQTFLFSLLSLYNYNFHFTRRLLLLLAKYWLKYLT